MLLPDVNVVVYAHRADSAEHARYAEWLRQLVEGDEPFAIADIVLAGFLRLVTNRRIFEPTTSMQTALAYCQSLVECPRAVLIAPSPRHWKIFAHLCEDVQGPRVSDAYLAALAIEHGCELVTTDSDFARFPGVRWRHPLRA